jgi:hypothetical protein
VHCSQLGTLLNNSYFLQKAQREILLVHVDVDQGESLQNTDDRCDSEEDDHHSVSTSRTHKGNIQLI